MERKICEPFTEARKQIAEFIFDDRALRRLENVAVRPINKNIAGRGQKKHRFKKEFRVPAFYDPNKHTIFYNKKILGNRSPKTIFEIMTHELLHSISDHSIKTVNETVILKSGLRKQYIETRGEKSYFRGLNEGMVQYLCNKITKESSTAYAGEVYVIRDLIKILGEDVIFKAFLSDNDFELDRLIRERLGWKWYIAMSDKVDCKIYHDAVKLISSAVENTGRPIMGELTGSVGSAD